MAKRGKKKLVIYTVLTGDKEPLGNPLARLEKQGTDLDLTFLCFTDDKSLVSDIWQMRPFESRYLPADKMSRRPKALPHEYLPEWKYSLYIDNIVQFKRLPNSSDLERLDKTGFLLHRHATRKSPMQEAEVLVHLGYEDSTLLANQLEFYDRVSPHSETDTLSTCTIMFRRHHDEKIKKFGQIWWEQILSFSKRDQISFGFAQRISGVCVDHYDGFIHASDLVHTPGNALTGRVKSSFDEKRYQWRHRDVLNGLSPKAHFLASNASELEYAKKGAMLEFLAYKNKSSLGEAHSPRRRVARYLGDQLNALRTIKGNLLVVRTITNNPVAMSEMEYAAFGKTLTEYLPFVRASTIAIEEDAQCRRTYPLETRGVKYDAMVFVDFPAMGVPWIAEKYLGAFRPGVPQGFVVILGTSSFDLSVTEQLRKDLEVNLGTKVGCHLYEIHHDAQDWPQPNSCALLVWGNS